MTDSATLSGGPATASVASKPTPSRCPWCSEVLPAETADRCPHCHANLVSGADARLPGLTEVEAPETAKARRLDSPRRSKLLSWISGEIDDTQGPTAGASTAPDAVALPPRDVRREMLRLQLEAEGISVAADGSLELMSDTAPDDGAPAAATGRPAPSEAGRQ